MLLTDFFHISSSIFSPYFYFWYIFFVVYELLRFRERKKMLTIKRKLYTYFSSLYCYTTFFFYILFYILFFYRFLSNISLCFKYTHTKNAIIFQLPFTFLLFTVSLLLNVFLIFSNCFCCCCYFDEPCNVAWVSYLIYSVFHRYHILYCVF